MFIHQLIFVGALWDCLITLKPLARAEARHESDGVVKHDQCALIQYGTSLRCVTTAAIPNLLG